MGRKKHEQGRRFIRMLKIIDFVISQNDWIVGKFKSYGGIAKSIFEKLGGKYERQGDYYIPDLKLPEEHRPIGKYGRMHREYLREVHPARLNTLILTGELWTYLADLNEQAQERLDTIMEQTKATEGVTEELKRTSQMEWVQRCNNIRNRAEEIVLHEMIYS